MSVANPLRALITAALADVLTPPRTRAAPNVQERAKPLILVVLNIFELTSMGWLALPSRYHIKLVPISVAEGTDMGPMSRRRFLLSTGGVAGCWPALSLADTSSADPGLGGIAASRGLLYGSLVRGTSLKNDITYSAALARECRLFVSALEMQWHNVSPTPISTDFSRGDAVYSWAYDHEIKLRGHALSLAWPSA